MRKRDIKSKVKIIILDNTAYMGKVRSCSRFSKFVQGDIKLRDEMINDCETEFGIKFEEEDILGIRRVRDIINMVDKKLNAKIYWRIGSFSDTMAIFYDDIEQPSESLVVIKSGWNDKYHVIIEFGALERVDVKTMMSKESIELEYNIELPI